MKKSQATVFAAGVAVLFALVLAPGASAATSGAAVAASVSVAYDARGAIPRQPSARYGLAVFDRQFARSFSHAGYLHHPYSRYRFYSWYSPWYRPYPYGYYANPFAFYGAWGHPAAYPTWGWAPDAGALDLNIKPKKAEVWVDREYLGTVDSYDGFPRYLWLRAGEHHLVVYLEGYETFAREVTVRRGEVLAIRYDLREGTATKPEELFATVEPREERRVGDEDRAPAREPYERREPTRTAPPRPSAPPEDWRDVSRSRPVDVDQRAEPARLRILVTPGDAVVYLDGRLIGSGAELDRLHSDLLVDPGAHRVEVTRPGYRTFERQVTVGEGEELVVRAELEEEQ